jgi:uncharacterized protein (DUF2235 family)
MGKNVLIFSDGTGQGPFLPAARRSNVWKLWNATCNAAPERQVAFYDPGLGAADGPRRSLWRWGYDIISQATGLGVTQNIKDCYAALIEHYDGGDRIFLFGFSRGAYTVRSVAGVLSLCGIPRTDRDGRDPCKDKAARAALVEEAVETVYKHYGSDAKSRDERAALGAKFRRDHACDPVMPHFIGAWDTVRALGIPGSTKLFFWRHGFHNGSLDPRVAYGRQALSIDEDRKTFAPEVWVESAEDRASGRIKQVWFPGVHSDIGGGYAESGLSDLALQWMIAEATAIPDPLQVDAAQLALKPAFDGLQHDARTGFGRLWTKGTREAYRPDSLHENDVNRRFALAKARTVTGDAPYRPAALSLHPNYAHYYAQTSDSLAPNVISLARAIA